ncbi:MAG: ABC transporter transmembrane domain-containing protein [Bacteroidota bacterium]
MKGFFKLISYVAPYKAYAFLNVLFNLLSIVFGLFSISLLMPFLNILFNPNSLVVTKPVLSMNFTSLYGSFNYYISQIIVNNGKESGLLFVSILVVVMILLKNVCRYMALFFMVPLRNWIVRDLRNSLYKHVLILPLSYFSSERKGDLITRMSSDAQELEYSIMGSLEALFKEPLTVIISLSMLIWISPMLTLIVFLCLPIIVLFLGRVTRNLKKQARRGQSNLDSLVSMFEETLMGVRIIKAFNAQDFLNRRFRQQNSQFTNVYIKGNRLLDAASPISETLTVSILAFVLWFGGRMVLNKEGDLTADVFIGFIALFTQLIDPAKAFSTAYGRMQKGLISLERIEEVLHSEEKIVEVANAKPLLSFNHTIEFKNVSFSYRDEPVLKNINLKIEKGKTVALVGPSGAGKSTLTDLIPRFYDPTEGSVQIDGIDIREYKILDLRQQMGMVSQESILFNDSIFNNIAFGQVNASAEGVENSARVANAYDFVKETDNGFQTNIGDRGNKLSGGQKQRISIARAVNKNPEILILDEATSALDTTSERLVQDALSNVMKGRTTVVIAHRLSTIISADLIVVLDKGQIVQQGTHQELLQQNGLYKELHDMQKLGAL